MFKLYALALIASFAGVANAHFRLLYPEPRGPFVSDQEPNFCGRLIFSRSLCSATD